MTIKGREVLCPLGQDSELPELTFYTVVSSMAAPSVS